MMNRPGIGIGVRLAFALGIVFSAFIVLTELTVSSIVRVSIAGVDEPPETPDRPGDSNAVRKVRRSVLLYLITGAALALIVSFWAIHRVAVAPLQRMTRALEDVSAGSLTTKVPVEGATEFIELARSFNRMVDTIRTQRTALETQLAALESSARELRTTRDELIRAAKLASVGTLASGVAHEIGNPIAGVLGLLDVLDGETDPDAAARYRGLMRKEVQRIDRTIADLLAYARPDKLSSGAASRCAVIEVFDHVQRLARTQKPFAHINFSLDAPANLPDVAMSDDALGSVLMNLFLNAAKAIDGAGRIEVTAGCISGWRHPSAAVERNAVRLSVTDSGPGIAPQQADHIFDPFFTDRKDGSGTGLGLAICQSVCERAGAGISLDREHCGGARFVITIPAA